MILTPRVLLHSITEAAGPDGSKHMTLHFNDGSCFAFTAPACWHPTANIATPQKTVEMVGYLSAGGLGWAAFVRGNWGNTEKVMDGQFADELARASVTKHTVKLVMPPAPEAPTAPVRTLSQVEKEIVELAVKHAWETNTNFYAADFLRLADERNKLLGK